MEFHDQKLNYNLAKADGAVHYLFTKIYNPLQYYNCNLKIPKLQPNVTIDLPFQDGYIAVTLQDDTSNEDYFQNLQRNLTWTPFQHLAATNHLKDSNEG
jgi:hypothetical protein